MTREFIEVVKSKFEREFNTKETLQVLTHNLPIFWSWGVSNRVNVEDKALVLKVRARRHTGYVVITLGYEDLYYVYLVKTNGRITKEFKGIFFEDLVEVIDDEIERVPIYSK